MGFNDGEKIFHVFGWGSRVDTHLDEINFVFFPISEKFEGSEESNF